MSALSTGHMRSVEKEAVERFGIPEIIMIENASRSIAEQAHAMVKEKNLPGVSVICGSGNNGGDGMAAARHMHNRGIHVSVFLAKNRNSFRGLPSTHLTIIGNQHASFDSCYNMSGVEAKSGDIPKRTDFDAI